MKKRRKDEPGKSTVPSTTVLLKKPTTLPNPNSEADSEKVVADLDQSAKTHVLPLLNSPKKVIAAKPVEQQRGHAAASGRQQQQHQQSARDRVSSILSQARLKMSPEWGNQVEPLFLETGKVDESLLERLTEYPSNYLVVGVIGKEGVNYRDLVKRLCGHHASFGDPNLGIGMFVTPERIIILDFPSLFGSSFHARRLPSGRHRSDTDLAPSFHTVLHALLMMAVCNVIVLVSDSVVIDSKLLRFMKMIDEARTKFPDLFPITGEKENAQPELFFVMTEMPWDKCCRLTLERLQRKLYEHLQENSGLSFQGLLQQQNLVGSNANEKSSLVNLCLLPSTKSNALGLIANLCYETELQCICNQIARVPRKTLQRSNPTEQDWLRMAGQTMDKLYHHYGETILELAKHAYKFGT